MTSDNGCVRLSTATWLKLIGVLFGHSVLVFSSLLVWTNRIVAVEVRIGNVESTVSDGMREVRADIKELLKRTKE